MGAAREGRVHSRAECTRGPSATGGRVQGPSALEGRVGREGRGQGEQEGGAGVARAWCGRGAGYRLQYGMREKSWKKLGKSLEKSACFSRAEILVQTGQKGSPCLTAVSKPVESTESIGSSHARFPPGERGKTR
eukprot:gene23392-biopygen4325